MPCAGAASRADALRHDGAALICVVINSLGRGGAERSILLLVEELLRRGLQVQLVCLFQLLDEYRLPDTLRSHVVRLGASSFLLGLWRLHHHLRDQPVRVVYSLMPQANLAALLVCRSLGLPLLTSERTTPTLFYASRAKLVTALLPHAASSRAVFISHYARDHGLPANALGRAVRRNACVLHNPVPCTIPPDEAGASRQRRLGRLRRWLDRGVGASGAANLTLLLASRLVPGKGILEFLQAALPLLGDGGGMRIVIAGAGPLQDPVRGFAQRHRLGDQLLLLGFVEDIQMALALADVVVLSSESEGFGRVGFEAYLAGCLVLGTRRNSFGHEVSAHAPAWHVADDHATLDHALAALAQAAMPDDGADIGQMRSALDLHTHANRFLAIVTEVLPHV